MKKVINVCLLWHNLNSCNYGVSALAVSQVNLLVTAAKTAGVEVNITTMGTIGIESLNIRQRLEEQLNLKINHINFSMKRCVKDFFSPSTDALIKFNKFDLVMDIGEGDSFTDIYGVKRFVTMIFTKLLSIIYSGKLVLSPQTIGPFNSKVSEFLAKMIMNKCDSVYSRDHKSTQYLSSLNVSCFEVSDVAFTLPFQPASKVDNQAVGINISGLLWNGGYSQKNQFGLEVDYQKLIYSLIDGFLVRGKSVHLVSHVISDELPIEDDYVVSKIIKEQYISNPSVILAPKFSSAIDAKNYMSALSFFTGSRMHATIGSLSAGVITVPIAYSRKFSGVFGSLGYNYTLDAFSLANEALIEKLFHLFDNEQENMKLAMESALNETKQRNKIYLNELVGVLNDI